MKVQANVVVRPARSIRGSVELPGDKSISHRYGMLSGIAEGPSRIENYSTGADCASTLGCMRALGVNWERKSDGHKMRVTLEPHVDAFCDVPQLIERGVKVDVGPDRYGVQ